MQDLKNIKFNPGFKTGIVSVPSSKSISHRALICDALSKEHGIIFGIDSSDDIDATTEALRIIVGAGFSRPRQQIKRILRAVNTNWTTDVYNTKRTSWAGGYAGPPLRCK